MQRVCKIRPLIGTTEEYLVFKRALLAVATALIYQTQAHALIYCPQQIECAEDGQVMSCKAVGDNTHYWGRMQENGRVKKGTYSFWIASAQYSYQPVCSYISETSVSIKYLTVSGNEGISLTPYLEGANSWYENGYMMSCQGGSPNVCPFIQDQVTGNNKAK